jgi:hypothetical protein
VIQLPCPEFSFEGPNRWAKSYQQFDTVFFREHCAGILLSLLQQLQEYVADGAQLVGVIGMEGSPSCGAYKISVAEDWGGCFDPPSEGGPWLPPPGGKVVGRGVFLETLSESLEELGWTVPVIGVPKDSAPPDELETFRGAVELMMSHQGLEALGEPKEAPDPWEEGDLQDWG